MSFRDHPGPHSRSDGAVAAGADLITPEVGRRRLHIAVVHGAKSVHLVAAAASRESLVARLAEYARQNAEHQLYPNDAERLRRLLADGRLDKAVEAYFTSVGGRWDEEWLVIDVVEVGAGRESSP